MSEAFSLPSYLTMIILAFLIALFIVMGVAGSKRKLTLRDLMNLVGQALFAGSVIIAGVNLIWWWVIGELPPLPALIEPPHPIALLGLFVVATGFWIIYENLRGFKKKR